ncbi:hypothetical protein CAEBREN_07427 [Caenorhabditis brenneri]|uniref:Uncharacterized protein n=1 Tax=Caenorhabditis brenneri TaxID=135651 RepID=G0NFA9_CAEBE|nr:hypothetical protein CAEBREN_07427 [Caenorhabditis brenneri]
MSVSSDQQVENLKKEAIAELEAYILVQFELQQNIRASDLKSIYRQFVFKHPGLELPEQEEMIKKVNEKLMQEKGYKVCFPGFGQDCFDHLIV